MANSKEIPVPDIGDFKDVPVIEVLVAVGDSVTADQPLIVLESDKSTMEVPAPHAGTVTEMRLKDGDKVSEGDIICVLEAEAEAKAEAEAEAEPQPEPEPEPSAEDDAEVEQPTKPETEAAEKAEADEPAPAAQDGARTTVTETVPDIGDFTGVPVIEVLVAEGDEVSVEQPLVVLESDKSTMEVPATHAGTVTALKLKAGDAVSAGDAICELAVQGGAEKKTPESAPQKEKASAPDKAQQPEANESTAKPEKATSPSPDSKADAAAESTAQPELMPHAGPAVRRLARELGVDLARVDGSGRKGRILREDVQEHVKSVMQGAPAQGAAAATGGGGLPQQPEVDFSRYGPVEKVDLSRIRRISAQHLHRNWLLVPHVTQTDSADITELEAFRKAESTPEQKLTLLPILMKAVAQCLRDFPDFNASLSADGQQLIRKQYCHVGFAADTPNGLLVPVIRDVWSKSVRDLAAESSALAAKARDGKLKPDEMQGGCFSISSLGGIGGSHFTPIVNAPEVAILGVSKASMQPVWDGEAFQPRLMCPLSLSYDHRVIDGAAAARFIVQLKTLLEDLRRLLL